MSMPMPTWPLATKKWKAWTRVLARRPQSWRSPARTLHRPRAARIVISVATKAKSRNNPDYKIASNTDGDDPVSLRRRSGGPRGVTVFARSRRPPVAVGPDSKHRGNLRRVAAMAGLSPPRHDGVLVVVRTI